MEKRKRGVAVKDRQKAFDFEGHIVEPGKSKIIELPLTRLYSHTELSLPVKVIVGRRKGPTVFLSAAIHGDEINGVEIIRRFLKSSAVKKLRGVLLVVPIVNLQGLLNNSRYLPDRRDLNRAFPGSEKGSLAARIADMFMKTIVSRSDLGIDLHSGAHYRTNLPQIRANIDDQTINDLARSFGAPVILNSDLRDGSLRAAMAEVNKPILLFEGGEALRFDEIAIRAGLKGVISTLRKFGSLPKVKSKKNPIEPVVARSSAWVRASDTGLFNSKVKLGARVRKGELLGYICDPFGEIESTIEADFSGIVIGLSNMPLATEGGALFHIARFDKPKEVAETVSQYRSDLSPNEEVEYNEDISWD